MQPINISNLRKILLIRTDRMGDVVVTSPVYPALKKRFPNLYLTVMVSKENEDLVRGNPFIDEVITYDKKGEEGSWLGAYQFAKKLKKKNYDIAIHFHPRSRNYWITYFAEIPVRIGYKLKNYKLLTHVHPYNKPEGKKHEAEYNFDLLKLIQVECPEALELLVPFNEEFKASVEHYLSNFGRYAAINPSASSISRIWPAAYFAQVADLLFERYGLTIILIGGASDDRYSKDVIKHMNAPYINLTGKLRVGALPWLFKKVQFLLSNDTGPVHVAGALGTPCLAIFGRIMTGLGPSRWRPLGINSRYIQKEVGCVTCLADDCEINFRCLKWLTPYEVFDLIAKEEALFLK